MTEFFFDPYGVLPGKYKKEGNSTNLVMRDWQPRQDREVRLINFNRWLTEWRNEIADTIWPYYDPAAGQWHGFAKNSAKELTELEIEVMIDAFMKENPTIEENVYSPLARKEIGKHKKHYVDEDTEPPGINYIFYDNTLSTEEHENVMDTMLQAVSTSKHDGKKALGHFWLKNQLQRPRPLHSALKFNLEKNFSSKMSSRGQHPSIISGHCFQGIMMSCAVLEEWLLQGPVDQKRQDSLAQFMVDIGDRRIFAGVHYPSDNMASWAMALSLIPYVFKDPDPIVEFVRDAIMKCSEVYQVVAEKYVNMPAAQAALLIMRKAELI